MRREDAPPSKSTIADTLMLFFVAYSRCLSRIPCLKFAVQGLVHFSVGRTPRLPSDQNLVLSKPRWRTQKGQVE